MSQKKEKIDYDRVFEIDTFKINIECNHCDSTDCFIGVIEPGLSASIDIDIVCHNCGHIEAVC